VRYVQYVITAHNALCCIIKCSVHQIMSRVQNKKEGIGRACSMHGRFQKLYAL
jgi:hypothetical protein